MQEYEFSLDTLAVIPLNAEATKVIEKDAEYIVNTNSMKIIDDGCRFFGSTYHGRSEGTKSMIGINYKSPIIIEESIPIIFFPTISPRLEACSWISFKEIEKYVKKTEKVTTIYFKNGLKLDLNIPFKSIQNQVLRASYLNTTLNDRRYA